MDNNSSERDVKIFKSACRMCHGGCGALVHVKEQKIVKITGDPESPLSKGQMCPKGLASLEHLYNPNRLKHPLKRAGKRGEGKWEQISWDEALDTIVENINAIKTNYGIEAVAVGTGTGRHHFRHVGRFAHALGTPNWCEPGLAQCFIPRIHASFMTYGNFPVCDYYGEVNPACVLVWGHNPVVSGPDGEIQFRVKACIKKGTKLIVVDPRRTGLAEQAEIWLQLRPGTDDALALSMLNVIISEQIYDKPFVEKWTVGFNRLAERVSEYTPEWAAKITEVPAEKIKAAARLFAQTKPATLEWGVAIEHTPNCFQTVRAVALLPGITGNIDIPGGWIFGSGIIRDVPNLVENLPAEARKKRMGCDEFRVLAGLKSFFPSAHIPTLFNAMRTGEPYPVKAFLIFGNNGLVSYANSKQVYESFKNLDFMSVMDIYMTPTAEMADIVLPAATWLEIDEIVGLPFIAFNVVLAQQKIVSVGEARPDEEVFIQLARRLNLPVGVESLEEIYNDQLSKLGITFQELKEKGFVTSPLKYRKYEERGFRTPSKKVELYSSILTDQGYDPLPYYQEPPESPISTPELIDAYPLILTTGGRSQYYFHSEYRQIPSLRKRDPDPQVEIHPDTAQEAGIQEGDWVWIETRRGRIKQRAKVTDGIKPNVVNVQHGWWFPEEEKPEYGVWNSNANVLTSNDPPYDPAMGTYQLRALLCKVYKTGDTE
ncbi:molybdopterin-dependent oxidoreductase [Thermodesulfobacteriota bacterium]